VLDKLLNSLPHSRNTGLPQDIGEQIKEMAFAESRPATKVEIGGVYLLFQQGVIVYVGQSNNVVGRIGTHISERLKVFDRYAIIVVDEADRLMRERQLIATFEPYYNCVSLREQGFRDVFEMAAMFNVPAEDIRRIARREHIPTVPNYGPHWCFTNPEWIAPHVGKEYEPEQDFTQKLQFS
jgi:hypothetical protein